MIVIGFTGPAGAGKDTAGAILSEYLLEQNPRIKVRTQAWADKLKVAAARAVGAPIDFTDQDCIDWCDEFKVRGTVHLTTDNLDTDHTISGREFLEKFGTEGGRNVYGADHWVNLALPDPDDPASAMWRMDVGSPNVIIDTTTRFPNEVERIRAWGGQVWRIDRPEAALRASTSGHVSRMGIPATDCDVVLFNDGDLDDLRAMVRQAADGRIVVPV